MKRLFTVAVLVIGLGCWCIPLGYASAPASTTNEIAIMDQPDLIPYIRGKKKAKRKKPKNSFNKSNVRSGFGAKQKKGKGKNRRKKDRGSYVRKKGARWSGAFF